MGRLFACIGKKATIAYSIPSEHICISAMEELCYYICDRAPLLDRSLMKESLVEYIGRELQLPELARELEEIVRKERPLHEFCDVILSYASYPSREIREQVVQTIRENETLPVVLRLERQGDVYMQQKQYYMAHKAYRNMLLRDDVQADTGLVAEIYEKLGNVAALMFQYETAAYCFEKSCRLEEKRNVRKKYLLCMRLLMSKSEYLEWVAKREEYYDLSADAQRDYDRAKQQATEQAAQSTDQVSLEELKEEFCRMVLE